MVLQKNKIKSIQGWLSDSEANILYYVAKSLPKDSIVVEIGSFEGKSTSCIAQGLRDGNHGTIYAIDPHQGHDGWKVIKNCILRSNQWSKFSLVNSIFIAQKKKGKKYILQLYMKRSYLLIKKFMWKIKVKLFK